MSDTVRLRLRDNGDEGTVRLLVECSSFTTLFDMSRAEAWLMLDYLAGDANRLLQSSPETFDLAPVLDGDTSAV